MISNSAAVARRKHEKEKDQSNIPGYLGDMKGTDNNQTMNYISPDAYLLSKSNETAPERRELSDANDSIFNALNHADDKKGFMALLDRMYNFTFDPHGTFITCWNVWMLFLVVVSSAYTPYWAAFRPIELFWWEYIIDAVFYIDMIVFFFTGCIQGIDVITNKKDIARVYLKGFFVVDFIATVQWDLFATNPIPIRMLRLFKLIRLARVGRLLSALTQSLAINSGFVEAYKFFFYVLIVAHVLACIFFFIPTVGQGCVDGGDAACLEGSWRAEYDLDSLSEPFQYVQSLYWAVTTMTTIGYGDRTPQSEQEMLFVILSQVFGLCIFGLLLTQINNLNDVLGESEREFKEEKNDIIAFMENNKMSSKLIKKVVKFLNFKSHTHSGRQLNDLEQKLGTLSLPLKRELRTELFLPVLRKIRLLGYNKEALAEEARAKKFFHEFDKDGEGSLDHQEVGLMVEKLGLTLDTEQLDAAIKEMDFDQGGTVGFEEFRDWMFLKKYGVPRIDPCPQAFLNLLATQLRTFALSPTNVIVKLNEYGRRFYIVLAGTVEIMEHVDLHELKIKMSKKQASETVIDQLPSGNEVMVIRSPGNSKLKAEKDGELDSTEGSAEPSLADTPIRSDDDIPVIKPLKRSKKVLKRTVSSSDPDPIFGLTAALGAYARRHVEKQTKQWEVVAKTFCDVAYVSRMEFLSSLADEWKDGPRGILTIAPYIYDEKLCTAPITEEDTEVVEHEDDDDPQNMDLGTRLQRMDDKINKLVSAFQDSKEEQQKVLQAIMEKLEPS